MKESPNIMVAVNLIGSVLIFGYCIRIFDTEFNNVSGHNFNRVDNVFWLATVTMTTVGYGEFFPKSWPSRIVGIVLAFWGVYLTSLFVITIDTSLEWKRTEENSFHLIQNLNDKEELKIT